MLEGRSRSGMFETYVFGGVLGNRLPFLRSVMLVSTMSRDCTQVCDEGEAGEELHVVKDGDRNGQALGPRQHVHIRRSRPGSGDCSVWHLIPTLLPPTWISSNSPRC